MHEIARVKKAIEEWTGRSPNHEIAFSKQDAEGGPSKLSVLFFLPEGTDDHMSWAFTLGLSAGVAPGETRSAELVFTVKGQLSDQDMEITAKQLAELAVLPYREGTFFEVGRVFKGRTIHPFTRMNNILIASWGMGGESLPGLDPPVDLLFVVPLFDKEAEEVGKIGPQPVVSKLAITGNKVENYDRKPVY